MSGFLDIFLYMSSLQDRGKKITTNFALEPDVERICSRKNGTAIYLATCKAMLEIGSARKKRQSSSGEYAH